MFSEVVERLLIDDWEDVCVERLLSMIGRMFACLRRTSSLDDWEDVCVFPQARAIRS